MKKTALYLAFALALIGAACSGPDVWNELPEDIQEFVSEYFPGFGVNDYTHTGGTYYVRLTDGPGIYFDSDCHWTSINGYGMPLPAQLLYDDMPGPLYEYLQAGGDTDSVFAITRSSSTWTVELLDSKLSYDVASHEVKVL